MAFRWHSQHKPEGGKCSTLHTLGVEDSLSTNDPTYTFSVSILCSSSVGRKITNPSSIYLEHLSSSNLHIAS